MSVLHPFFLFYRASQGIDGTRARRKRLLPLFDQPCIRFLVASFTNVHVVSPRCIAPLFTIPPSRALNAITPHYIATHFNIATARYIVPIRTISHHCALYRPNDVLFLLRVILI